MVGTVTVPPWASLTPSAISRAYRSSGLNTAGRAARLTVPCAFITWPVMLAVSDTCFTSTTES